MTTEQREAVQAAVQGIDVALTWLEADLRRLERALAAGISLELIGVLNRIALRAEAGA